MKKFFLFAFLMSFLLNAKPKEPDYTLFSVNDGEYLLVNCQVTDREKNIIKRRIEKAMRLYQLKVGTQEAKKRKGFVRVVIERVPVRKDRQPDINKCIVSTFKYHLNNFRGPNNEPLTVIYNQWKKDLYKQSVSNDKEFPECGPSRRYTGYSRFDGSVH